MSVAAVQQLADAYAMVAVADAARDLGMVDVLSREPMESLDLAARLELDPIGVAFVLASLHAMGLVTRDARGRYAATPAAAGAGALGFWRGLPSRLKTGAPATAFDTANGANRTYPKLVGLMADIMASAVDQAAERLAGRGPRVLDVGAGASPWSLALVEREPHCHVTAIDRPAVLEVTKRRVDAAGRGGSFDFVPADLTSDTFGDRTFDLAIVANVCHLFGDGANRSLVRRLFSSLRPGGTIAVVDSTVEDEQPPSLSTALYALSLFVRTSEGAVHAFSSYCAWLREAGFRGVQRLPLSGGLPLSLIVATRPEDLR